jgi:hypothetical protein
MSSGLPTVLVKPRTRSRTLEYTYDAFHESFCVGDVRIGDRPTRSCALCDRRSERISFTRANEGEFRASRDAIEPVVGTMLVGATNTGRPASSPSANLTVGLKLRSTWLCWFRFSE